jgi:hypothetical protein
MATLLGLLAFVVLMSCVLLLRERRVRRAWQILLQRVLNERNKDA